MSKLIATNIINEKCLKLTYHNRNETKSNLPFQITLYINAWFFPLWLLTIVINLDAKYESLTNVYKFVTVAVFLVLSVSESLKLYLGYVGNLAGKIPELASCWLILILIQLPLEMFLLLDHGLLSHSSEMFMNSIMVCLLLVEIVTGIINTEGAMWKDQRKFLHDKLRSFGMTYMGGGKKIMESRIMREVKTFLRGLASKRGAATDVSASLGMSISNVICSIIMGVRFQHGDVRFKRFMDLIEEGFKLFGSMAAVNFIPVMRYLPCLQKVRNKISQNRAEMADFFQEAVDQHRATFDETTVRDLVDAYLLEIKKAKGEGRATTLFQGKNHDRQMQQILGDLFSAGMETVKTTLEWAIILMLHHPDAATAVQEELDQVVGKSRMPGLEDLPFLPITEATILEVLRRSSIVPLGTTHATTRDVTLHGFMIPAGSQVVPLLHAVHMDPELWEEPEEFRPSRFLSAEGKVQKPEYFMPFGVGRRMCLGDVLARMELFLFFSSLMHTFELQSPQGSSLPSLRGNAGVTVTPDPFDVCLLPRNMDLIEDASNDVISPGPILRNIGSY